MRATLVAVLAATVMFGQKPEGTDALWAEKTKVLGSMMAQEYRRTSEIIQNPAIQAYVEAIGSCLAPNLADESVEFQFEVMKNHAGAMHEPIGLPAGHVFVPIELVRDVQNDSEFAAMLAHAMWHSVRPLTRAQGTAVNASIPLYFAPGLADDRLVVPLGVVAEMRKSEAAADPEVVKALAAAGFDPGALRSYVWRVQAEDLSPSSRYYRFPPRAERIEALEKAEVGIQRGAGTCNADLAAAKKAIPDIVKTSKFKAPSLYNSSSR